MLSVEETEHPVTDVFVTVSAYVPSIELPNELLFEVFVILVTPGIAPPFRVQANEYVAVFTPFCSDAFAIAIPLGKRILQLEFGVDALNTILGST